MTDFYILDNQGNPKRCPDPIKWAEWFETNGRQVAKTDIHGVSISTVFLGIDHSYSGGVPILYETMIFTDYEDFEFQRRYTNKSHALAGHKRACHYVRNQLNLDEC